MEAKATSMLHSPAVSPAAQILAHLKREGVDLIASLSDQWLGGLIAECDADPAITHVKLAREDDGVGYCAGAYLGGRKAALLCQNAGLLLSINALSGVAYHHQIPLLVLASLKGSFETDHYYHLYKGRVTEPVLRAMGLPYHIIDGPEHFGVIGQAARQCFLGRLPLVLLMRERALVNRSGASI